MLNLADYTFVDLIYGEEKSTTWQTAYGDSANGIRFKVFPKKMKKIIKNYLREGGNLFVSGAYIGSDMFLRRSKDSDDYKFCTEILRYRLSSDHAVKNGNVSIVNDKFSSMGEINFNTEYREDIYKVEAPDAIGAVNGSETFLRYIENLYSAGVAYKDGYGVIALGIPFETILTQESKDEFMKSILKFLKIK